jgi:hypothetical protein
MLTNRAITTVTAGLLQSFDMWTPRTTSLTAIIEIVIRVIENAPDYYHILNHEFVQEYWNDYQIFYGKALRLKLVYGRSRRQNEHTIKFNIYLPL